MSYFKEFSEGFGFVSLSEWLSDWILTLCIQILLRIHPVWVRCRFEDEVFLMSLYKSLSIIILHFVL